MHILVGPYELFKYRNTNGQVARRGRDIHFPRYHVERSGERGEFVGALEYLLERVPLSCDLPDLLKRWRWFAEGSVGCVGILKTWLVDAVTATFTEGRTTLTVDALTRSMLHPAQRVRLELDARAGEHQVKTTNADSARQLQILLGKTGKAGNGQGSLPVESRQGRPRAAQTEEVSENLTASFPMPQVSPKPTQPRVGERSLGRDSVGETGAAPLRKATGCSFLAVIDLLPSQMEEVSVTHVECPACLAVRDIQPKGESVKFPWHPKRVTNTPNHGLRWVKRESAWQLSE